MATVLQGISGLYVTLYNRAADDVGEAYWAGRLGLSVTQAAGATVSAAQMSTLASLFVSTQSTYFNAVYGALNDTQFIQALYRNLGGNDGDAGGILYWVGKLAAGTTRTALVGQFVNDFININ